MIRLLEDIQVVDLTSNIAGPFASMILRDLGATVIKIENPQGGDPVRSWPPFGADGSSAIFAALNRGKKSIALDLRDTEDRGAFLDLVRTADIVIESMRPQSMQRLNLGAETLRGGNPRLIYVSLSAFGNVGPFAGEPGFDAIVQAYSGIMKLTGETEGPPVRVGTGVIDLGSGMWAALATLAALVERSKTGRGLEASATLLGTAVAFLVHHLASVSLASVVPQRLGSAQHNAAPYEAIQTADGTVMVGAANDGLWLSFCEALSDNGILRHSELFQTNALRVLNRRSLVNEVEKLTASLSSRELVERMRQAGVPASEVRGIEELMDDPQVSALQLLQPWGTSFQLAVTPLTFDGEIVDIQQAEVPALDADRNEVLQIASSGDPGGE